jgi:hypothetical protein
MKHECDHYRQIQPSEFANESPLSPDLPPPNPVATNK